MVSFSVVLWRFCCTQTLKLFELGYVANKFLEINEKQVPKRYFISDILQKLSIFIFNYFLSCLITIWACIIYFCKQERLTNTTPRNCIFQPQKQIYHFFSSDVQIRIRIQDVLVKRRSCKYFSRAMMSMLLQREVLCAFSLCCWLLNSYI